MKPNLQAGAPTGNQNAAGPHEMSVKAAIETDRADDASAQAKGANGSEYHDQARHAHEQAAAAHTAASKAVGEDTPQGIRHMKYAGNHEARAQFHKMKADEMDYPSKVSASSAIVLAELNARFNLKRMEASAELQAAIAATGYSYNDLQDDLRKLLQDIPSLCQPPAGYNGDKAPTCAYPWLADVKFPAHEAGETWSAIVQGADGKLYEVQFAIDADGKGVSVVGQPKLIEKETDYNYVFDQEAQAEARAAVEAGDVTGHEFRGNQWTDDASASKELSKHDPEDLKSALNLQPNTEYRHGKVSISRNGFDYHSEKNDNPEIENTFDLSKDGSVPVSVHRSQIERHLGTSMASASGTSEGAVKGWESRKGGIGGDAMSAKMSEHDTAMHSAKTLEQFEAGDVTGHEFHGNQWTDGESRFDEHGDAKDESMKYGKNSHVTEYENDDLNHAELKQKAVAYDEDHNHEGSRYVHEHIAERLSNHAFLKQSLAQKEERSGDPEKATAMYKEAHGAHQAAEIKYRQLKTDADNNPELTSHQRSDLKQTYERNADQHSSAARRIEGIKVSGPAGQSNAEASKQARTYNTAGGTGGHPEEGHRVKITGPVAGTGRTGTIHTVTGDKNFVGVHDKSGKHFGYFHVSDVRKLNAQDAAGYRALEAGDAPGHEFHGNQYSQMMRSANGAHFTDANEKAESETEKATRFSEKADRTNNRHDIEDAAQQHLHASIAHHAASQAAARAGETGHEHQHQESSFDHETKARQYISKLRTGDASKPSQSMHQFFDRSDIKAHQEIQKVNPPDSQAHKAATAAIEHEAKKIGAGKYFEGRSWTAEGVLEAARADTGKFSADPFDHSLEAFAARKVALASGKREDHDKAKGLFLLSSEKLAASGRKRMAALHAEMADEHDKKMKECQAAATPPIGELQAHAELDCAADQTENGLRTMLPAVLPEVVMYMPGGIHTISPSQITATGRKPVTVSVLVDELTARNMEDQREALEAAGKKPFFSLEHESEKAAFWPSEFFWDKRVDANGDLVEGVWARGEWTKSGREAVEGKDYRTFSPSFFVEAVRNDPSKPVKVVCNVNARANMGALENDPAFKKISALWARSGRSGPTVQVSNEMRQLVRNVHTELASFCNPSLAAVQARLSAKYDIRLTEGEIGRHLID